MDKKLSDFVYEKTHELMNAHSCCSAAKTAAQNWLDALGTPKEAEETKKYISELEEDVLPLDAVIAFTQSPAGTKFFGAEKAEKINLHAKEIKAQGKTVCDCPACTAATAILEKKSELI